jgi:hypothetical protein
LQTSGYATDPRYAEKIRSIIASPILGAVESSLKPGAELPKLSMKARCNFNAPAR